MALQRSLGWRMLVREFQMRRESLIELMLNPETPLEEVRAYREQVAGAMDLLGWPKRQVEMSQPVGQPMRAGLASAIVEEGNG